jgi:FKBP-type peptidyl-prolyl cis-trans isomerase FklB
MAGFVSGTTGKGQLMTIDEAANTAQTLMASVKAKAMEEKYGDWKKQCEDYMAKIAKKEGIKELGDGVYYEVITEGKGAIPADTNKVSVNYEGKLLNDTIFDSSYQRGEPADFGLNQVIAGWTEGVQLMKEGAKFRFTIPYMLAYGEGGAGVSIPPYATLVFDVELIKVL